MLSLNNLKYIPYSYSKIATYQLCPRKFKYFYIDKLEVKQQPQVHFDRGKLFHLLLEYDGNLEKIKNTQDWNEIKEHKLLDKSQIKEIIGIYKKFISTKPGKDIVNKKVFMKEFALGLDKNLKITKYDSEDVLLRGYIDAAYLVQTNNEIRPDICILVDWKSGKYKSQEEQTWYQLLWYSLGLFDANQELQKIILVYAYVEHNKINTKILKREDIERYKKTLYDNIQRIEQDTEFPKKETALCQYCDFEEICSKD